jgi:Mg-chelatase subunit ChlD
MILTGEVFDNLEGIGGENLHEKTGAQELFQDQLEKFIRAKDSETLPESRAYGMLTQITNRARRHPDIVRGPSVRGTIAFKDILGGFSELNGVLTQKCMMKAALITLPPRISVARKGTGTAIIGDIMKEVLYRFSFQKGTRGAGIQDSEELSATDILSALSQLGALPQEEGQNLTQGKSQAVMPDAQRDQKDLKYLEELDFVRRDERGQYVFTGDAVEFLLNGLEEKLKSGEISLQEYHRQKSGLMRQMRNAAGNQPMMSKKEMANTIFEMIDAQDKQWNSNVNFSTMYVYYHIKSNRSNETLHPQKSDYYGLKRIMDDLVRQKVLVTTEEPSACNLTGFALDVLFQYFVGRGQNGEKVQEVTDYKRKLHNERRHETRKFSSGDTYRNISMRRTLKEIARQRKSLSEVRKSDFRVFIPQSCKPKSDIILCLDTSGSMGFNQKLMYARLVAAGIARAAVKDGNRVGIVAFNDFGKVTMPLTAGDEELLLDLIAKISPRGNTNIGDGIKFSAEALLDDYNRNQKHIILISDGIASAVTESAVDQLKADEGGDLTEESALLETKKAASKGIQVSVVYIAAADEVSDDFISSVARFGNGKVYRITDSKALTALFG